MLSRPGTGRTDRRRFTLIAQQGRVGNDPVHDAVPELKRPVFILGAHKSGTSLLRSLLDTAPGFFVLPKESHFFAYSGRWIDYPLRRRQPRSRDWESVVERLVGALRSDNVDTNPYSDLPDFEGYDLTRFRRHLERQRPEDDRSLYATYIHALVAALGSEPLPAETRIVDKSTSNMEYATYLEKLFPDASFVHVVRNPYANLVAMRKYATKRAPKRGFPMLYGAVLTLQRSAYFLYRYQDELDRHLVVRYEDLVSDGEETMRKVATHLGVEFDPVMLQPTVAGKPWAGNSTSDVRFAGLSAAPLAAWRSEITRFEIELVNRALGPLFDLCGYERADAGGPTHWLRRAERERLRTYVGNRSLLRLRW
jgi:sulfotransferase family protein